MLKHVGSPVWLPGKMGLVLIEMKDWGNAQASAVLFIPKCGSCVLILFGYLFISFLTFSTAPPSQYCWWWKSGHISAQPQLNFVDFLVGFASLTIIVISTAFCLLGSRCVLRQFLGSQAFPRLSSPVPRTFFSVKVLKYWVRGKKKRKDSYPLDPSNCSSGYLIFLMSALSIPNVATVSPASCGLVRGYGYGECLCRACVLPNGSLLPEKPVSLFCHVPHYLNQH